MNAAEKRAAARRLTDGQRRATVGVLSTALGKTPWGVEGADRGPGSVSYRLTVNGKPVNKEGVLERGSYPHYANFHGDEGLLQIWAIIAQLREQAEALGLKLDDSAIVVETQTSAHVYTTWSKLEVVGG